MGDFWSFMSGIIWMGFCTWFWSPGYSQKIEQACQGKSWIIEEPLIKKTLTCVVEIKENK